MRGTSWRIALFETKRLPVRVTEDQRVRTKYEWVASYHNWAADSMRGPGRVKVRDRAAGQFGRL
jgi:hypothetical protein